MSTTIKELVDVVAETGEVTKVVATKQVEALFDLITSKLKEGEEVVVRNFGRFYTKVRPARTGRNPKTGEPVQIAEKQVVKLSPRGDLK